MQDNEYVKLIAALDLKNSAKKINQDIKQLEKTVNYLRLTASLYKGESKKQINAVISEMQNSLKSIKLKASINKQDTQKALDNVLKDINIGDIRINENGLRLKARKALLNVQSEVSKLPIPINFEIKKQNLQNQLTSYLAKNSKIRESSTLIKEADNLRALFDTIGDKNSLRIATEKFGLFKTEVTATGFATKSTTDKVNDLVGKLARVTSIFGVLNIGIQKYRQSLTTLKDISTTLTEIAKTSNMVGSELKQLGDDSFGIASKYGKIASNYLESIREMARSGYDDMSKELGELSVLAQSAGDMTSEMANNYLLATDAAYKYGGSIDKLTSALDGANYISNRNSATLTDIADATRVSASYAAQAGVEIDQLTAAESTMIAVTKRSGSEMGRAFRSILLNLQKVKGEFDGEIIDDEQLAKVEKRCHDLGVELEVMGMNGAELRNPMQILKELSEVYNSLPDNSVQKQGLISDLGGKYHANALAALLGRWDLYEKMLGEFSQGAGSSLMEAQKTAESWEGRLNALQNQWDSFVNHITDQNMIKGGISLLDNILKGAESLVDTLGAIPTLLTAINGTYTALNKDYGITQIFNPETNKLDMQGNMFGIDFTAIKAQKQHFIEAEKAILQWNSRLKRGQTDLDDFGAEIVKNNAQLRAYLSTTSKEAPASLAGYKASLNAAGVSTDALRLKTVLMTSAMTFGLSFALQAAISGISKLMQYQENLRQTTAEAANTYNDSSKSIDDYTARYKELHDALLAAKGNEEETYNVKKQLLDLQTELNDKFGEEYGHLSLVTDAYRDQTDAIKAYNKEAAQKFLNEQEAGIKLAEDKMTEKKHYNLSYTSMSGYSERGQALIEIAKKYEDAGVSLLDETGTGDYSQFSIHLDADAQSAYETIHAFETDVRNKAKELGDEHIFDDVIEISSASVNNAKKIIDDYGKEYKAGLTANIIADDNLAPQFEKALEAVEAYNEAVLKSENPADDKKVDKAYADLQKVKAGILENEEEWGRYSAITDDVFAQADTGMYEFRDAIKENKDGIADLINQFKGKTDTDILSLSDVGDDKTFNKLIGYADEYGLSVNQVVDELIRMEIITGEIIKETSNEINPFSKGEMISAINELSEGFESLDKIMASINSEDPFDYSLLDDSKFKETFSELGDSYADFIDKISNSPKDINACQSAFDDLLTAWVNSTNILDGLSDETADLTINMLSNMGVANAEEVVTSALIEKHAQLAAEKYYNATASAALEGATANETLRILEEADAAGISTQYLAQLELAKIAVNGVTIDTNSDIDQIINLANAAGSSASALYQLAAAKAAVGGSALVDPTSGSYDRFAALEGERVKHSLETGKFDYQFESIDSSKFKSAAYGGGTKTSKSSGSGKGSGGGSGSGSEKEPTDFDWMERRVEVIDSQVEKLQDKIDILIGYKSKNKTTDTAIDLLIEKMDILQQMHDRYMSEADKIGLAQEYIDKIQNGLIDLESIGDEGLVKQIQDYQDLYDKAESANKSIIDTKKSVADLNKSKLDNINNQFKQTLDITNQIIDTEKQLIDLREKSGETVYADDYISLAGKQLVLTNQNIEAYKALSLEMRKQKLKKGSEEWKEYNDQLQEYKNNMISAADAVEQYKDVMTELVYKGLNDFKSAMDSVNGTISTMNSLIGNVNLIDDSGNLTDRGLAQVALYAQQLANAKQESANYAEAIRSLDEALDSGLITQDEYNERLYEYTSAQESAVQSTKDAKDAMIALVKEGIQAQIDAKRKLTDETIAALRAEQDLYKYQNEINEKQKNITTLQKKIAALANASSGTELATRLKLEQELAEAQKELYETQYDHNIEQQENALNEAYDAYEKEKQKEMDELDSNLAAQEKAIEKYLNDVKKNYSTVYKVLTQYGDEYSLSAIESLTSPWESGTDAANLCSNAIGDAISTINFEISNLDMSPLLELIEALNSINEFGMGSGSLSGQFEDISGTGSWQKGKGGKWWYGEDYREDGNYDYASDGIYTIDGKQYGFDSKGYMQTEWAKHDGNYYYFDKNTGEMQTSLWIPGKDGKQYYLTADGVMAEDMAIKYGDGYCYVDKNGVWDGKTISLDEVERRGLEVGYKRGTLNATPGWHMTDEDGIGTELIVSSKGVLRRLDGGETVFNADAVQNLWDFASNPARFMGDLRTDNIPTVVSKGNGDIKIDMPITIEGSADEKTVTAMKSVVHDEMVKFTKNDMFDVIRRSGYKYRK